MANQLRFELLLLHRMEPQAAELHAAEAREPTLAEVYAAAVLRSAGRDLSP